MKWLNEGLTYDSYPEAGVTKCYLNGVGVNPAVAIIKLITGSSNLFYISQDTDGNPFIGISVREFYIDDMFKGASKANLSAGDKFDPDYGKELAHERCMAKYHKQFDKKLKGFIAELRKLEAIVEHYCDRNGIDYSDVASKDDIRKKMYK